MRGMRGVGSGGVKRTKGIASRGRNVEGATYVVVDVGGERMVRCKGCLTIVATAQWWGHSCGKSAEEPQE
jgi:hypothetical protein